MFEQDRSMMRALDSAIRDADRGRLVARARRISELYREGIFTDHDVPLLNDRLNAIAYASSRMPATCAAVRSALGEAARQLSGPEPRTHLDLGGGTGASVWAAAAVWPAIHSTVLEQAPAAIGLGKELTGASEDEAIRDTEWIRRTLDARTEIPAADLITMSYVLGELPEQLREDMVGRIARNARVVALLEPGSPGGYARIIRAREILIDAGMTVLAPCPHSETCPLLGSDDWCHMSARTSRTALHQEMKSADRNYEDEPFSYVVASAQGTPAPGRILRRPRYAKGRVQLEVCAARPSVRTVNVTKKDQPLYRAARDAAWGDAWPPEPGPEQPGHDPETRDR